MDSWINKLSSYSSIWIIIIFSFLASILSASIVYTLTTVCGEEHTIQLYRFSVIIPLVTTPIIMIILIRLTKHLKHFKDDLEKEIEKNKKKDVMLFEQARFALMGEMMANISHQWKQPLNTINLAIIYARTSNPSKVALDKYFDIVEDNVNYLATTIDDFMSFFDRKTHLEIRDLPSIIKEIISIIQTHVQNKKIGLEIVINDKAENIMIASSISQVILNLINNSKDAFDEESKNKNITVSFTVKKDSLEIECRDNGNGIPPEIEDKIFDPYFTTKEKKQGTGIGLYMSKQIIQKLFNGTIQVNSKRKNNDHCKKETCFFINIPYSDNCVLKNPNGVAK